jgi:hypothetical protein
MNNEFKKSKSNNETRYTLESITAGATGSGSVATSVGSVGKVQKRGNILAQEAGKDKVDASKPRNFVAKNAKMGGAGAHKDKKKAQKQGTEKHKKPYMEALKQKIEDLKSKLNEAQGVAEEFNGEYDDEAGMAQSNLLTTARAVKGLLDTIEDKDNLPEWAQEKIAKAEMMLVSVWDYLQSQKEMGNDPQQGVAEGPNDGKEDNFTIDDIKNLERIRDFETLKAQAKELIKGKPARRMKPEKISWFYNHIDTLKNPLAVIKMMYDLMLAGEGNKVIGSRNSMSANSYRSRFGEQGVSEAPEDRTSYQVAKILFDKGIKYDAAKENELINMIGMILVKELMMSPKQARHLISYDEDFVSDTLGELGNMESSVSEVAPPGWEKTVKAMKKHDNIDNPFALAWSMKNKGYKSHKKESADPYFESLASKLDDLKKKK